MTGELRCRYAELSIHRHHPLSIHANSEVLRHPTPARGAHFLELPGRTRAEIFQHAAQRLNLSAGERSSSFVLANHLRNPTNARADHRLTERIGLQQADGRVLIPFRGQHDSPAAADDIVQLLTAQVAEEGDISLQ